MISISVSMATVDDLTDCHRLLQGQQQEHGFENAPDRLREVLDQLVLAPARGFLLLARHREQAIGVAYAAILLSVEHGGPVAWLEELYVLPEHREQGIGTALLTTLIEQARERGIRALDL